MPVKRRTVDGAGAATKKAKTATTAPASGGAAVPTSRAVADIKKHETALTASKTNANELLPLIEFAASADATVAIAATQALRRVLLLLDTQLAICRKPAAANDTAAAAAATDATAPQQTAETKLHGWLHSKFTDATNAFARQLHSSEPGVQVSALHTLMDMARIDYQRNDSSLTFVLSTVQHVVANGALTPVLRDELLTKFIIPYDDVRFAVLKKLSDLFRIPTADLLRRAADSAITSDQIVRNALDLLLRIKLDPQTDKAFLSAKTDAKSVSRWGVKPQKKALNDAWIDFLKLPFPTDVYKSVLFHMDRHILPVVGAPLTLADFLTDSYNVGGVVSLLALDGLFILIAKYNLDYPNFFTKLYQLCTPAVFHAPYRVRFFKLVSKFLTSSYLPAYLVSAFVKRFSRITLTAPPDGCVFICHLILNLLRRHPTCRVLIDRVPKAAAPAMAKFASFNLFMPTTAIDGAATNTTAVSNSADAATAIDTKSEAAKPTGEPEAVSAIPELGEDVFLANETDPLRCCAISSSLWELKALTTHYTPIVVTAAKLVFAENAPKSDVSTDDDLQLSYSALFERELQWRKKQKTPLAYQSTNTLFGSNELLSANFNL